MVGGWPDYLNWKIKTGTLYLNFWRDLPEGGFSMFHCCSGVLDQSGGGDLTIQMFPGLSSSSATVHVVRCLPVSIGSECTTCAVIVRWLGRTSRFSSVPRGKGRIAWITQPWLLTSVVRRLPLYSESLTKTGTDCGIRWLRRRSCLLIEYVIVRSSSSK